MRTRSTSCRRENHSSAALRTRGDEEGPSKIRFVRRRRRCRAIRASSTHRAQGARSPSATAICDRRREDAVSTLREIPRSSTRCRSRRRGWAASCSCSSPTGSRRGASGRPSSMRSRRAGAAAVGGDRDSSTRRRRRATIRPPALVDGSGGATGSSSPRSSGGPRGRAQRQLASSHPAVAAPAAIVPAAAPPPVTPTPAPQPPEQASATPTPLAAASPAVVMKRHQRTHRHGSTRSKITRRAVKSEAGARGPSVPRKTIGTPRMDCLLDESLSARHPRRVRWLGFMALCLSSAAIRVAGRRAGEAGRRRGSYLEQGLRLYNEGKYDAAIRDLRLGYALEPLPEFLYTTRPGGAKARPVRRGDHVLPTISRSAAATSAGAARFQIERCEQQQRDAIIHAPAPTPALRRHQAPPSPSDAARSNRGLGRHDAHLRRRRGRARRRRSARRLGSCSCRARARPSINSDPHRLAGAQTMRTAGIILAAAGGVVLVAGVIRLALVARANRRRRREAGRCARGGL